MSDRLGAMELFVRVIEAKSFSAAARALGTSQSRVSKSIATLEKRLDARLLVRTTRHVSLTQVGAQFYRQCKAILSSIEEAESAVRLGQHGVNGTLRVNTSAMLAMSLVQPALLAFRELHPAVGVEIIMDDRRIDPVEEGVDLIVRVGVLNDSRLMARRVGSAALGFYAAPAYLAGIDRPIAGLADLAGHAIISAPGRQGSFEIRDDSGDPTQVQWSGAVKVSNAILGRDAAVAGAGIAVIPNFLAGPEVASGALVPVLASAKLPALEISFLHPFGQSVPRKVSAFMDFAIARWREAGALE